MRICDQKPQSTDTWNSFEVVTSDHGPKRDYICPNTMMSWAWKIQEFPGMSSHLRKLKLHII